MGEPALAESPHHEAVGVFQGLEAEFCVERVGVASSEYPAAEGLQVGVG